MRYFIQSPITLLLFGIVTTLCILAASLMYKRHPLIAENIICSVLILLVGFFVAMKLFFIYPQLGYLWFFLWVIALMFSAIITGYLRSKRKHTL